jgi:predicted RNA binding protein YcfA (HicA-like mRNA interferase family)/predicted RNase H-like HicB family nuclease
MKIGEIVRLLERDGWNLKRVSGSHRHFTHPTKSGLVTVAGKPSATLKPEDRVKHPEASGPAKGAAMTGYVVVFEGDDASGYSAYSPDLPGVIAAGDTRQETESLMIEAMAEHIRLLRQTGQPVPEPSEADSVTILDPAAA